MAETTTTPESKLTPEQLAQWQGFHAGVTGTAGSLLTATFGQMAKVGAVVDDFVEPAQEMVIGKVTPLIPAPIVTLGMDWLKAAAPEGLKQVMEDPGLALSRAYTPILRELTLDDEKAIKFATALGANEEELKKLDPAINESVAHLGQDNTAINTALAALVKTKEPAALLKAFAETDPSAKLLVDEIAKDPAMTKAVHAAVSQDITVLEGLQKLAGNESSLDQETMINALQDPVNGPGNRQLFTKLLTKVAEDPNLKFDDFAEVVDAGVDMSKDPSNKAKQKRYMDGLLNGFGMKDRRAEMLSKMGTPIEMLGKMWEDPNKFFDELAETLGGSPEQVEALKGIGEFFANFIGMYSNDPHIAAFMETYGPRMSSLGHALLSGKGPAGVGDMIYEVDPTKSFNTATTTPAPEAPAVATVEEPEADAPKRTARIGSPEGTTLQMG